MGDTIVKLYLKQNYVIGEDILKAIKKSNLTLDEALLMIYFCSNNSHPILDIEDIKQKFGLNEIEILQAFESIGNKNLLTIKMEKNKEGKMEEIIDLTPLYETIAIEIGDVERKKKNTDIFSTFESEFGRPLSSMEYEVISKWLDKNIEEDLINAALKEAIFNGTMTLRYIDAVLMEWIRKGFKTSKDVDLHLKKKKSVKQRNNEDLFDYNWLDDEE